MTTNNTHRRVVITGMGTVSPLGLDVPSTWEGMLAGRSGAAPITTYDASELPTRIAATIKDFDAEKRLNRREARRLGRLTHLAIDATDEAINEAGLDLSQEDPERVGIEMGSAFGALSIVEEYSLLVKEQGFRAINPALAPAVLITTTPCYMAIRYGIQGVANSPVAACATGVVSLGEAARRIQRGEVDVMLAGGTDSYYTPLLIASFSRLGAMSTRNDDPETACRPFDAERDGMIMGEGAVTMVLESLEHAQARGATILAEYGGMGFTVDGHNMAAPDPDGQGASRAIKLALADSAIEPEQLDYVAAHGTGTQLNDISETRALKKALGEHAYGIPVVSNKPMIGHAMGAAGAFNALTIVQAIRTGWVPPTINYSVPDPECDLDYVPNQPRQVNVNAGVANAFGFGGQNGAIVIKRYQE
ncbi:MAG: beta-ketoacyl-ACP synthase II [Caldilineales bacterium]|nr:beta-ketoacyl-ACP synthase II [Caldilineales bacterium]